MYYSFSFCNSRSAIALLISAFVVELLCVKAIELRRGLVFGGARCEFGHDVHGHGKG
jgi:hypothetical protein